MVDDFRMSRLSLVSRFHFVNSGNACNNEESTTDHRQHDENDEGDKKNCVHDFTLLIVCTLFVFTLQRCTQFGSDHLQDRVNDLQNTAECASWAIYQDF